MAKVSAALQHPFLMAVIPAMIGLGGAVYLANKDKTVDEAEKIYWNSIQPPNDSDEKYCSYLKKYPHGNFIEIAEAECSAAIAAKEQAAELAEKKAEQAREAAEAAEEKATAMVEQKAEAEEETVAQ
jgi:hypothetical protein